MCTSYVHEHLVAFYGHLNAPLILKLFSLLQKTDRATCCKLTCDLSPLSCEKHIAVPILGVFMVQCMKKNSFRASAGESRRSCEIRWSDFAGIHPSPAGRDWNDGFRQVRHPSGYPPAQPLRGGPRRDRIWRLTSVTGTVKGTIPNAVLSSKHPWEESSGILQSGERLLRPVTTASTIC